MHTLKAIDKMTNRARDSLTEMVKPFKVISNPHYETVKRRSNDWVSKFYGQGAGSNIIKSDMTSLTAGFYPYAGLDKLSVMTYYLCWAFILDDIADETAAGQSPQALAELFQSYMNIFNHNEPLENETAHQLMLRDIISKLSEFMTDEDIANFAMENYEYFSAMLWEANNRYLNWVPGVGTFIALRPAAGAVPPFFTVIEIMGDIRLPDDVKNHPCIQNLVNLASGLVCWINDVLTFSKEKKSGDVHNLVILYEHHYKLSPDEAFNKSLMFCQARIDEYLELSKNRPNFGEHNGDVEKYITTLNSMIGITFDWTMNSKRYATS
jgi:hypothetical protein